MNKDASTPLPLPRRHLRFGNSLAIYRVEFPNGVVVKCASGGELDALLGSGEAARWQPQQIKIRVEEVDR